MSFFLLPRTPAQTAFLTEEERRYVQRALIADGTIAKSQDDDEFSWLQVGKAFKQVHVILMALVGFFSGALLSRNPLPFVHGNPRTGSTLFALA